MFRIEIDLAPLIQASGMVKGTSPAVQKATISALNWVGRRGLTQVKRGLVKTTGIPYNRITEGSRSLYFKPASPGRLWCEIRASSPWTPLGYFRPVQTKGGVRASAWEGRKFYPGAFILTFDSGHVGVFHREGEGGKRITRTKISPRTGKPIKYTSQVGGIDEMWGPSLQREMMREPIPQLWEDTISTLWGSRFGHELQRNLIVAGKRLMKPK